MNLFEYRISPADLAAIVGVSTENLRVWRSRNAGPMGEFNSTNGRYLYCAADIIQIWLQQRLSTITSNIESAGRCASLCVYGDGGPIKPMHLFPNGRTYLVIVHHPDGSLVSSLQPEKEAFHSKTYETLESRDPRALASWGHLVTMFELMPFYNSAIASLRSHRLVV